MRSAVETESAVKKCSLAVIGEVSALASRNQENERKYRKYGKLIDNKPEDYLQSIQDENQVFHNTLLVAASSPRLMRMAESLVDIPITIGSFYLYSEEELRRSAQRHRELVHAIDTGSYEYAKYVMQVHLQAAYSSFMSNRKMTHFAK